MVNQYCHQKQHQYVKRSCTVCQTSVCTSDEGDCRPCCMSNVEWCTQIPANRMSQDSIRVLSKNLTFSIEKGAWKGRVLHTDVIKGPHTSRESSLLGIIRNVSTHEICDVKSERLHTDFESLSRHAVLHGILRPAVSPADLTAHSMAGPPTAVGIDLGTSNSCVHVLHCGGSPSRLYA